MFDALLHKRPGRILGLTLGLMAALPAAHATENWVQTGVTVFAADADPFRGQGVTTDGSQWFFSGTNALERAQLGSFTPLQRQTPAIASALANPNPLAYKGLNHIGDIDYANGLLYISLDSSQRDPVTRGRYETPVVAIYNASDLSFTGKAYQLNPPHGTSDIASWVAVDANAGLGYAMAYDNATEMTVYNLADWSFNKYLSLSTSIDQAQGCKIYAGGAYCASDDASKTIRRVDLSTGKVEDLFSIKTPYDQEIEGLAFIQTAGGLTLNVINREDPDPLDPSKQNVSFYQYTLTPVPEPATSALLGLGLVAVGLAGQRRRRSA